MKSLVFAPSFKKAFKNATQRKPELVPIITETLKLLAENPFNPQLRSHKLKGRLAGSWSCTVTYDCRIIFSFEKNNEILLMDVGSHDDVY